MIKNAFLLAVSQDTQKAKGASGDYSRANDLTVKALDKELREPPELVFFPGCVYECTMNDPRGAFSQSQTALLLQLPTDDVVRNFSSVAVWVAPVAGGQFTFDMTNPPTPEEMRALGWTEVKVGCAPERDVNVRGGLVARRTQYALKHIGATTINKSMGSTLPHGIATEITPQYSPW